MCQIKGAAKAKLGQDEKQPKFKNKTSSQTVEMLADILASETEARSTVLEYHFTTLTK